MPNLNKSIREKYDAGVSGESLKNLAIAEFFEALAKLTINLNDKLNDLIKKGRS